MKNNIKEVLKSYLNIFKEEKFEVLEDQLEKDNDIISRKNFIGHVTASGLVLSEDNKVLLIFHNRLKRLLPPGGHIEDLDENIMKASKREVEEEVGIKDLELHSWYKENNFPIMIEDHYIPECNIKNEGKHIHHDFLFLFKTKTKDVILQEEEVSNYIWRNINDIDDNNLTILKAIKKMKELNFFDN